MGLLDFLFPKKCIGCKRVGEYLCFSCFTRLSSASFVCLHCGNPCIDGLTHPSCKKPQGIDGAFCGFSYNGVVKKLLYSFKYQPYVSDLGSYLSELLYEQLIQHEVFMNVLQYHPVFVPIPLFAKKLRKRGYNQAEILANNLAKQFNRSIAAATFDVVQLLERKKDTKPQFGLDKEQRRENMSGAFNIISNFQYPISNFKSVILIDDVLTTGSTLLEAAKVLKRNGVQRVYGICFAYDQ